MKKNYRAKACEIKLTKIKRCANKCVIDTNVASGIFVR